MGGTVNRKIGAGISTIKTKEHVGHLVRERTGNGISDKGME